MPTFFFLLNSLLNCGSLSHNDSILLKHSKITVEYAERTKHIKERYQGPSKALYQKLTINYDKDKLFEEESDVQSLEKNSPKKRNHLSIFEAAHRSSLYQPSINT